MTRRRPDPEGGCGLLLLGGLAALGVGALWAVAGIVYVLLTCRSSGRLGRHLARLGSE